MQCKKCGKESVEGAAFCGYCGARVDGKLSCGKCGGLNDEGMAYCVHCGTRIDGKTVCANCGNVCEGNFCPICGKAQTSERTKTASVRTITSNHISNGALLVGVLFSLIFVFFIGLVSATVGDPTEKQGIFYYFGEYYEDLDTIVDGLDGNVSAWFAETIRKQGILLGVISTCLSVLSLLCVVAFATVAIVKYVRSWVKKETDTSKKWSIATIVSYLASVVLYYALNFLEADLMGDSVETKLNGATVVALVFIGGCVAVSVVFTLLNRAKEGTLQGKGMAIICTLLGCLVASLLFIFVQNAGMDVKMAIQTVSIDVRGGYLTFNVLLDSLASAAVTTESSIYYATTQSISLINICNVVAQITVIAIVVLLATYIYNGLQSTQTGKGTGIILSVCITLLSVLLLVMSILSWNECHEMIVRMGEAASTEFLVEGSLAMPIVTVVFATGLFVVSILRWIANRKVENE